MPCGLSQNRLQRPEQVPRGVSLVWLSLYPGAFEDKSSLSRVIDQGLESVGGDPPGRSDATESFAAALNQNGHAVAGENEVVFQRCDGQDGDAGRGETFQFGEKFRIHGV